jgi:hypothetical protein
VVCWSFEFSPSLTPSADTAPGSAAHRSSAVAGAHELVPATASRVCPSACGYAETWVAIVGDGAGQEGDERAGFIVRQVKVRHEPDMVPVRALINLADRHRALVRGGTGRHSKA